MPPPTSAVEEEVDEAPPSPEPTPKSPKYLDAPPGLPAPKGMGSPHGDCARQPIEAPPGLSLPDPAQIPLRRQGGSQASDSPAGSMTEPEPEVKAEADGEKTPPSKRFCVWCGKQVPPKLVTARFCVFCGGVHNGETAGSPNSGKPNQPKLLQAHPKAPSALEDEARRRVAIALAEQSAGIMAWSQSQAATFGFGAFGKVDAAQQAEFQAAATYGGFIDPVFLPLSGVTEFSSEAWGEGSSFGPDPLEDGNDDGLWAHRWQRSLTAPPKMQYTNEVVTPAMLYNMQANHWN